MSNERLRAIITPRKLTYSDLQAKMELANNGLSQIDKEDIAIDKLKEQILREDTPEHYSQFIEALSDFTYIVFQVRQNLNDIAITLASNLHPKAQDNLRETMVNLEIVGKYVSYIFASSENIVDVVTAEGLMDKLSEESQWFISAWKEIFAKRSVSAIADFVLIMDDYRLAHANSESSTIDEDLSELKMSKFALGAGAYRKEKEQNLQLPPRPKTQYGPNEEQEESSYRPFSR